MSATIEPHPSRVYTEMNGYQENYWDITRILLGFTSTFADIPGSIACKLITLVLYLVIPRFEEPRKKTGSRVRLVHGRILQIE